MRIPSFHPVRAAAEGPRSRFGIAPLVKLLVFTATWPGFFLLADDGITLRERVRQGDTATYTIRRTLSGSFRLPEAGLEIPLHEEESWKYAEKILRVRKGKVIRVKRKYLQHETVRYDAASEQNVRSPGPLEGKLLLIEQRGKYPEVSCLSGPTPPEAKQLEIRLGLGELAPERPVEVGDSWELPAAELHKLLQRPQEAAAEKASSVLRLTLTELTELRGEPVARIESKFTWESSEENKQTKFELAGTLFYATGLGKLIEAKFSGPLRQQSQGEAPDKQRFPVSVEAKVTLTIDVELGNAEFGED